MPPYYAAILEQQERRFLYGSEQDTRRRIARPCEAIHKRNAASFLCTTPGDGHAAKVEKRGLFARTVQPYGIIGGASIGRHPAKGCDA